MRTYTATIVTYSGFTDAIYVMADNPQEAFVKVTKVGAIPTLTEISGHEPTFYVGYDYIIVRPYKKTYLCF